ncbi:hypothetical protein Pla108_37560 [Botrimarina colliarenosi]|uniref:Uncharacterized protein n=1 Tax=Botrimarina colliarenosi TaxID=2528001 RepID=A0A5C6A2E8_9BACT|nr:hypothetical protein [Botrimarina colliarenosi]TWT94044.1 hypothetical protein Pla108_37560 [Botrimarina colliarenosi]
MRLATIAAAVVAIGYFAAAEAEAQVVYVTGYAPAAPVVYPAPTVVYRPATPYFAYSPVVVAPGPAVVASAPTVVVGGPVVTRRYRPILGGTVTRVRYPYTTVVTPLY